MKSPYFRYFLSYHMINVRFCDLDVRVCLVPSLVGGRCLRCASSTPFSGSSVVCRVLAKKGCTQVLHTLQIASAHFPVKTASTHN